MSGVEEFQQVVYYNFCENLTFYGMIECLFRYSITRIGPNSSKLLYISLKLILFHYLGIKIHSIFIDDLTLRYFYEVVVDLFRQTDRGVV